MSRWNRFWAWLFFHPYTEVLFWTVTTAVVWLTVIYTMRRLLHWM